LSENARGKNVPSLDLLRSYAIVSVVAAHAVLAFGAPPALAPLRAGGTGVDLFFILSGWLLGGQLMRELAATGTISFRRFWSRRWMRTLPAYYAVLSATFLQQAILKNNTDLRWSYWFFGQNYLTDLPYFFVSWSLCVEEHFYLFVAPLLLIAFRLRRRGIVLLLLVMAAPSFCRTFGLYGAIVETHVRFDECLLGVVLAGLSVFFRATWARLCALAPLLASVGLVLYAGLLLVRWYPEFPLGVDEQTICMFVFGSFLLFAVSSEKWKQRLYVPGCTFLAARAYSVYLLHPEAVALLRRLEISSFPLFLSLTWLMTLAGAEILYRLVERPGMNAREWFKFSAAHAPTTSVMPPERHE
jgi:peptidoglycan/LPS O-acetylase OafA/YrhL